MVHRHLASSLQSCRKSLIQYQQLETWLELPMVFFFRWKAMSSPGLRRTSSSIKTLRPLPAAFSPIELSMSLSLGIKVHCSIRYRHADSPCLQQSLYFIHRSPDGQSAVMPELPISSYGTDPCCSTLWRLCHCDTGFHLPEQGHAAPIFAVAWLSTSITVICPA